MTALTPTARNTHRNMSRNSLAIDKLMRDANLRQLPWVLYQYCAKCSRIEALIVSATTSAAVRINKPLQELARRLQVPVVIVEHVHRDEAHNFPVSLHSYHGASQSTEPMTLPDGREVKHWDDIAVALNSVHAYHSESSSCPTSSSLLADGTWKTEDSDASISNVARRIPGVRHIDIDASVYCPRCYQTQLLIEASSTGMRGTSYEDQVKEVRMTRRVAKVAESETILLLHHPQDESHKEPVMMTSWVHSEESNTSVGKAQDSTTWGNVRRYMKSRLQEHQRTCVPVHG